MQGKVFYMLHVDGGESPTARHSNMEQAMTEGRRLASLTKKPVFILKALTMIEEDVQHIYHGLHDPEHSFEHMIKTKL